MILSEYSSIMPVNDSILNDLVSVWLCITSSSSSVHVSQEGSSAEGFKNLNILERITFVFYYIYLFFKV